jgi:hypothetical protein
MKRDIAIFVNAFQRAARRAETVARDNNNGNRRTIYGFFFHKKYPSGILALYN